MDSLPDPTVLAARKGHRPSLQLLLCEQYDRLARRIAVKLPPNLARQFTVDDVLQETFVQAIRDVRKCRAESRAQFAAWLSSIADNRLVDLARAAGRKKRGGDRRQVTSSPASSIKQLVDILAGADSTASSRMARREAGQAIHVGIASLPDAQRKAVEMRFLEGHELHEIAERLETSPEAIRGLLYRARRSLRELLGQSSRWFRKK